ncbi:hypothetical protein [Paraflavitalea pollutisoli]|uniref:hypothetical protein n=1 Tax=Paraflavitalea pollutisoli TaxID=3034143 RepID=UPI0023ECF32B|nr:hypothetical protein [Paraflavitalea sp. H1-2-19X]
MLSQKEFAVLYETVLASPGMTDSVKLVLHLPRKQVLILSKIIEVGIAAKGDGEKGGLLASVEGQLFDELAGVKDELLQKAGLKEMSERINSLISKQPL